jgi:C4-dicarboxylate transporter, DctQ subunit
LPAEASAQAGPSRGNKPQDPRREDDDMKTFNAVFDRLVTSMAVIAGISIIGMMLVECYEVVSRYFFHSPTIWSVEFCEYMLFLLAFLGTTWVLRKKAHISVTIVVERLSPKSRAFCHLFASLVGILICAIIFWFSLKTTWENYESGVRVIKTYALHKWFFLSFIALGYLLLLVEFTRQFAGHLRSFKTKLPEGESR